MSQSKICVSIGRTRHKAIVAEHRRLAEEGADLVELRLDWLQRNPDLTRLLPNRPTPCVITCRRKSDRGRWAHKEEQRVALLRAAIAAEADYVDLEDDIAQSIPRFKGSPTKRIISHHDFGGTPENLEEIHEQMCQQDADLIKLVTMANSTADNIRMLKLVADAKVPTVGFCMGELGLITRILCGRYGSPFSYATFSRERELAPGQVAFGDMGRIYRYEEISEKTEVFGVLGDPIAHSLSPLLHNLAFQKAGLDAVYLPLRVPRDQLVPTLNQYDWLGIRGYSVTIPHKQDVLKKADSHDDHAREIAAANTLFRDGQNRWHASNTDYDAALASLNLGMKSNLFKGDNLKGQRVLMLGAGGVARAVAVGVLRQGAVLTITNRTQKIGIKLAEELECQFIPWENRGAAHCDILINCTPVGMHPEVDETPFLANWINEGTLVFDTIYNPENTLLIKQARERDCATVSGVEMFVRQAAAQFERFTSQPAPLELMRDLVRQAISPVDTLGLR